ncbi:hypothetical protein SNE40_019472 [Patella caerulea]|uniref:Protein MIX23 n=1 Tax=Patella caerulea TaxID=87958 RepID=A0AAN8J6J6_PATCE
MSAPIQEETKEVSCVDFLAFQDALKRMRLLDDRIVYSINTSIPTDSFAKEVSAAAQCEKLYTQMNGAYQQRERIIKKCITEVSNNVNTLRQAKAKNEDDLEIRKNLRKEQNKLRLMQTELNIEEVLKDKSFRTFDEKCRRVYTIPKLNV